MDTPTYYGIGLRPEAAHGLAPRWPCISLCMTRGHLINQLVGQRQAAQASPALATAVSAAVMAQAEPTIVWYGIAPNSAPAGSQTQADELLLCRAWSDGRVEIKRVYSSGSGTGNWCNTGTPCSSEWLLINDPAAGLAAKADITNDKVVYASDLSYLLAAWGDAPPVGVPPSDCPLNLINP